MIFILVPSIYFRIYMYTGEPINVRMRNMKIATPPLQLYMLTSSPIFDTVYILYRIKGTARSTLSRKVRIQRKYTLSVHVLHALAHGLDFFSVREKASCVRRSTGAPEKAR